MRTPLGALRAGFAGLDPRVPWISATLFVYLGARLSVVTFVAIFFIREQGLDATLVGVAFLVENVMRALGAPLAGALSDRIGRVPVMAASAVAAAVLMPTFLLVDAAAPLLAWSLAIGLAQSAFFPVSTALLLDLVPIERRQRTLALNYGVLSVGYTVGVAPAGFLAEQGFVALGLASGAAFLLAAAIVVLRLRGVPRDPGNASASAGLISHTVRAFRDPPFLFLALLAFTLPLGIGLVTFAFPLYAVEAGLQASQVGVILAANGLLLAVIAVPTNALLERYGPFRSLPLATLFVALAYLFLRGATAYPALFLAIAVFTVGETIFSAALPTAVASLAPAGARGSYQGAWGMVTSLGIGSALVLAGLARDALGWPGTWLVFAAVAFAAALALMLAGPRLARISADRGVARVLPLPGP